MERCFLHVALVHFIKIKTPGYSLNKDLSMLSLTNPVNNATFYTVKAFTMNLFKLGFKTLF